MHCNLVSFLIVGLISLRKEVQRPWFRSAGKNWGSQNLILLLYQEKRYYHKMLDSPAETTASKLYGPYDQKKKKKGAQELQS